MKNNVKELCVKAMLCALVCIATMVIQIPVASTGGYIHLGDSIILISGIMFGPFVGLAAGGVGSALADILSGYGYWAPFTLVIKALMGYAAGRIAYDNTDSVFTLRKLCAVLAAEGIMIAGYLAAGAILKSSFLVALMSVPENAIQAAGGSIIYFVIAAGIRKTGMLKTLKMR